MSKMSKTFKFKISDVSITVIIDGSYIADPSTHYYGDKPMRPTHYHAIYELYIVGELNGQNLTVVTEDKIGKYNNCLVCIPPFYNHYSSRYDDFRILFSYKKIHGGENIISGFTRFMDELCSVKSLYVGKINDTISFCINEITTMIQNNNDLSDEMITSLLKLIFYNIYYINSKVKINNDTKVSDNSYLVKIDSIIEDYNNDVNLQRVADELKLSTKHTSRIIKKYYKKSLADLLMEKRLGMACVMLTTSNISISQIIEQINFPSESYFYAKFKKAFGCTPLEYRKRNHIT